MSKIKLGAWGLGLALTLGAAPGVMAQQAPAKPKIPTNFEHYGPFVYSPDKPRYLLYHTAVGANDLLHLKKALREHPTISTIILHDNGGGLVHIGLVIAEEIYDRGLNTFIPKDSYCASACSFVFFAGKERLALGRLGVHQISAPEMNGVQAQFGVSDIVATLPKYGVSPEVLGIMFSTPPKEMYFFKPHEIAKYGINRPETKQAAAAPAPTPAPAPSTAPSRPAPSPGAGQGQPQRPAGKPSPYGGVALPAMPQTTGTPSAPAAPASPPKKQALTDEQRALNAAVLMIQAGSGTNEQTMAFTREFYADPVHYFKKKRPKSEILADKEAYFQRWPVRRFVVDKSSLRVKCEDELCAVAGRYDYTVASPERDARASGVSNFTYVLDLRDNYRIVMEDSEVISR